MRTSVNAKNAAKNSVSAASRTRQRRLTKSAISRQCAANTPTDASPSKPNPTAIDPRENSTHCRLASSHATSPTSKIPSGLANKYPLSGSARNSANVRGSASSPITSTTPSHPSAGARLNQPGLTISLHVPPSRCLAASSAEYTGFAPVSPPPAASGPSPLAALAPPSILSWICDISNRPSFRNIITFGWSYTEKLSSAYPKFNVSAAAPTPRGIAGSGKFGRPKVSSANLTPTSSGYAVCTFTKV